MHADEAAVDEDLVLRLIGLQFPQWAGLPVKRLESGGTVNAVFRLGDRLSVRLPLTRSGAKDLGHEALWLPRLAAALPVAIPKVVAVGVPGEGYPWQWAVHQWIDGENPVEGRLAGPGALAEDLGRFVRAMRSVAISGGPKAYRGGPLSAQDNGTRKAIEQLRHSDEPFDADAVTQIWQEAVATPSWEGEDHWVHSDLMPSNLLVVRGRLSAVIDFATVGVGDGACDLIPAWNLFAATARKTFRDAVDVDDATWRRGRGWALSMAVIQLPYYRNTNPVISANARYVIGQVLTEGLNA